jgi:hypothetical protein
MDDDDKKRAEAEKKKKLENMTPEARKAEEEGQKGLMRTREEMDAEKAEAELGETQ